LEEADEAWSSTNAAASTNKRGLPDGASQPLVYANADLTKLTQAIEVLVFAER